MTLEKMMDSFWIQLQCKQDELQEKVREWYSRIEPFDRNELAKLKDKQYKLADIQHWLNSCRSEESYNRLREEYLKLC